MDEDIRKLADALYRERVLRARRTPPEERILDGIRLYDFAVELMRLGVKFQHPDADDTEVERLLIGRIRLSWKLSDHGYYRPA